MQKQTLGQEIIEALEEVVAHQKGSIKLEERIVNVTPKSADVVRSPRRSTKARRPT
jgi:hypothetical protein